MTEFKEGDRVRIRQKEAAGFMQPLRRFAQQERAGTVVGFSWGFTAQTPIVLFDTKRPPKRDTDYRFQVAPRFLELVP